MTLCYFLMFAGYPWAGHPSGPRPALVTQAQFVDDLAVAFQIGALEIAQQAAPFADLHEQAAPAGVVFLVRLEMLGEVVDRFGQKGDLDFGRPGIVVFALVLIDDRGLMFFFQCHAVMGSLHSHSPADQLLSWSHFIRPRRHRGTAHRIPYRAKPRQTKA